tara:strand:+ start:63383 stop:63538 length:156 start_codon:yes stop_codon:yes gene_type:complete
MGWLEVFLGILVNLISLWNVTARDERENRVIEYNLCKNYLSIFYISDTFID